jgi:hypothetical protein
VLFSSTSALEHEVLKKKKKSMRFRWAGVIDESDYEVIKELSLEDRMKLSRISESKNIGLVLSGKCSSYGVFVFVFVFVSSLVADETNEGTEA